MTARGSGRVLVTGGAGFIGSHLVELLLAQGRPVRVLEKPGVSTAHLPAGDVEILFADLRGAAAIAGSADGCEVVLHLAANPNLWARDPREFEEVNHQGTRRVLDAARRAGAGRVVHVSTESILAPPGHSGFITEATETDPRRHDRAVLPQQVAGRRSGAAGGEGRRSGRRGAADDPRGRGRSPHGAAVADDP